ncbi:MAG: hypothetical protein LAP40_28175 [Acidobacteriia bacterium]|nr:hypothetical protein [Terriglobia bacterium]
MKFALAAAVLAVSVSVHAEVLDKTTTIGKTVVHYKVVLPAHYDAAKAYPAILAFGGGPQTMQVVEGTLERNWREQAEKRGYLVIAPAAPEGDLFFEGGARVFPEFLAKILADYKIGGGGRRAPVRRIRRRAARLRQIGAEAPFLRGRKVVYSPAYAFPRAVPVRFDGVGTT